LKDEDDQEDDDDEEENLTTKVCLCNSKNHRNIS
jgi:hypothetical protein